jgi:hypothetical protein
MPHVRFSRSTFLRLKPRSLTRGFLCAREWPTETVRGSQRPDCVAEDAVRSKTVSRPGSPCSLRFAGRFSQNAGRANPISPVNLLMVSITWKKFSRPQGAGRDCGCCREDFGKLQGGAARNCECWQGWRRFRFASIWSTGQRRVPACVAERRCR